MFLSAIGTRDSVYSAREEQGRRGEKGVEEDVMDEGEYTDDTNEKYSERWKKEDMNDDEHEKENRNPKGCRGM